MNKLVAFASVSIVAALVMISSVSGQERGNKNQGPKDKRIVVAMDGLTDFTVTGRSTLFRIPISTIAGGSIKEPKITGKAKLVRTDEIIRATKDGKPLLGATNKEFVFRGTGSGKVTIVIEVASPTAPKPIVHTFNVTIK